MGRGGQIPGAAGPDDARPLSAVRARRPAAAAALADDPLLRGPQFDFDVQPVLAGEEVPWCVLGSTDADAPRLGWNIWIRSRPFERDVSDAVFSLEGESWITES